MGIENKSLTQELNENNPQDRLISEHCALLREGFATARRTACVMVVAEDNMARFTATTLGQRAALALGDSFGTIAFSEKDSAYRGHRVLVLCKEGMTQPGFGGVNTRKQTKKDGCALVKSYINTGTMFVSDRIVCTEGVERGAAHARTLVAQLEGYRQQPVYDRDGNLVEWKYTGKTTASSKDDIATALIFGLAHCIRFYL